jgi:hypothetical protein
MSERFDESDQDAREERPAPPRRPAEAVAEAKGALLADATEVDRDAIRWLEKYPLTASACAFGIGVILGSNRQTRGPVVSILKWLVRREVVHLIKTKFWHGR